MSTLRKSLTALIALALSGALASDVYAQRGLRRIPNSPQPASPRIAGFNQPLPGVAPFAQVAPGLNIQQAAFNVMVMGRALSFVPPYALPFAPPYSLGYSPFQRVRPSMLTTPGIAPFFNPFLSPWIPPNPVLANRGLGNPYFNAYLSPYGYANPYLSPYGYANAYGGASALSGSMAGPSSFYGSGNYAGALPSTSAPFTGRQGLTGALDNSLSGLNTAAGANDGYGQDLSPLGSQEMGANGNSSADPLTGELNGLVRRLQSRNMRATDGAPLDSKLLHALRFAPDFKAAHAGLLRDLAKWPPALQAPDFRAARQQLADLLPKALEQAARGRVSKNTLEKLTRAVEDTNTQLALSISNLDPLQYLEAKRYLDRIDELVTLLRELDGTMQAKTASQLAKFMKERGLQFAPPAAGDRAAYERLQKTLAAYGRAKGSK